MPMDENLHKHERIDAYLQGKMPAGEQVEFEQELASNLQLKEELELHGVMVQGVKEYGKEQLKQELKNIDNTMNDQPVRNVFPRKMFLAASVALLTAVGIALFTITSSLEQEIFAQYYEPWESEYNFNIRGPIPEGFDDFTQLQFERLKEGADYYDNGQYEEAIELLKDLEHTKRDNMHIEFILGLSYLGNEQPEEARSYLESLIYDDEFKFVEEAKWYYCMCLVSLEETEKALSILNQISGSVSSFSGKAADVIKALEE